MQIIPLAADSLGTRSMATYIETADAKILIDPGVAIAPNRHGQPPHPIEQKLMMEQWAEICRHAQRADILVVTHYHYDHHNPEAPEIYQGKIVYLKDPQHKINKSQAARAKYFIGKLGNLPQKIEFSDGNEFRHGKTSMKFSAALPHGADEKLGCVTAVSISDGENKFVHTSDIEGATVAAQEEFIINEDPEVCLMDGPMTYIYGMHTRALAKIINGTKNLQTLIVDHHFLRDLKWREKMGEATAAAQARGIKLVCAAEFLGKPLNQLEPVRKQLFTEHPASSDPEFNVPWKAPR